LAELAGWDKEILAIELQALVDLNLDVGLTGFEPAQVDLILDAAGEATDAETGPEDEIPAYAARAAASRPGDLWELGRHLLLFFVASSRASQLNTAHLQAPPQADNAGPVALMLSPCNPCSLA
jgi:hypothetical protein